MSYAASKVKTNEKLRHCRAATSPQTEYKKSQAIKAIGIGLVEY